MIVQSLIDSNESVEFRQPVDWEGNKLINKKKFRAFHYFKKMNNLS